MRTRREQVQAQRFVIRRIVSAMLSGNPETLDLPMRRMTISVLVSVAIAALVFTGFWVVGFIYPGGATAWKKEGALVIEEETGATYVYSAQQGRLYPMANYASARLFIGNANPETFTVHRKSLLDTPRAAVHGIAGAPDALPDAKALKGLPWQVCSAPPPQNLTIRESLVLVGAQPGPSTDLGVDGIAVGDGSDVYLLWSHKLFLIPDDTARTALGITDDQVIRVDEVLVNALPRGPKLSITAGGGDGRSLDGEDRKVGEVFTSGGTYYVLTAGGLAPIHELAMRLLTVDTQLQPETLRATTVTENKAPGTIEPIDFPEVVPPVRTFDEEALAVCGVYARDGAVRVAVHDPLPADLSSQLLTKQGNQQPPGEDDSVPVADRVWLPGGGGALVRSEPAPGAQGGTTYLLTDAGRKFPLTPDGITALGYGNVSPVPVPPGFVALVPSGPTLSAAEAQQPVL